ncbi:MAG: sensor domain CHASE-containing protein, partial [Maribacter sp.]
MINFFRRIRKKMLTENKFAKYLTYAIGEIFLVVIGILIALQINNWNEEKIQKQELNDILQSVANGLESDLRELNLLST